MQVLRIFNSGELFKSRELKKNAWWSLICESIKGELFWVRQGGSSSSVVAPEGPWRATVFLPGRGLVHQPCVMAEYTLLMPAVESLPSRLMGQDKCSMMGVSELPPVCSRPTTPPCVPESVLKLGTIQLIRIYFSKLQLQFSFVSLK